MGILIKNGFIVNPESKVLEKKDLLIENEIITKVNDYIDKENHQVIKAGGLFVLPGLIDIHAHFREPGFCHKETVKTGSMAAAKGGYTTVFVMPNTNPCIDNMKSLRMLKDIIKRDSAINVLPIGAVTKGQKGIELNNIKALYDEGIYGVSDDGQPIMDSLILEKALMEANKLGIPLMSHSEDKKFVRNGCINEGAVSKELGLVGIPREAENIMVERDIVAAKKLGLKIHICHISTKESVKMIRKAKEEGVKVTCEVTPHHFSLTEGVIRGTNSIGKVNPPLRTEDDIKEIIKGIKDGTIDAIATDHAPHSKDEKSMDIYKAPFGISGIELAFSISNTYLLKNKHIDIIELAKLMSLNPSKIMGIEKGRLRLGNIADITVVDLDEEYIVKEEDMISMGKNTPFLGKKLFGKVKYTIVSGKVIYRG